MKNEKGREYFADLRVEKLNDTVAHLRDEVERLRYAAASKEDRSGEYEAKIAEMETQMKI